MTKVHYRARLAGLVAGIGFSVVGANTSWGQTGSASPGLDALPPLPAAGLGLESPSGSMGGAGPVYATPPEVRPTPAVTLVPPDGIRQTWFREADDPVAQARKGPRNVEHKRRSAVWRRLQGRLYGYPEEFVPRPLGAALYDHTLMMTANAAAAKLTLYNFDFVPGSAELSPRGLDQLSKLVPQLLVSPYPLLIERTPDNPALASARREAIAVRLAQGPCPLPPERILVGVPIATGLRGVDAQIIAGNSLGRVQQYGPPIPIQSNGVNSPSGVTQNYSGGAIP